MKLYNTMTRQLEPVTSQDGTFRMYVCGVTPYDTTHLGHAFTFVSFDVLERYLEYKGYRTLTVQNVTDIDDDILRRAGELNMDWHALAERETARYLADMRRLNVREPDHYPWATAHIDDMITLIKALVESGLAYVVDGSVYYEVGKDPDFGKLAGYGYDEMLTIANERGNFPDDPNKRDPLDFVLWQVAKPGEPTWESPWGPGRPGWHIECSAMSTRYLGPRLDVHCGGEDLVFPHHAAEIAQSEHATGEEPFVRYWMHVAMVRLAGEKMSKSLGNMLFVGDLVERYSPQAVRAYLLFHHYRGEWAADDADERLADAEKMLTHWEDAVDRRNEDGESLDAEPFRAAFEAAMDNDLDTPTAMRELDRLAVAILDAADEGRGVRAAQSLLVELAGVLGLALGKNEAA